MIEEPGQQGRGAGGRVDSTVCVRSSVAPDGGADVRAVRRDGAIAVAACGVTLAGCVA